jgi:hypothetical protein
MNSIEVDYLRALEHMGDTHGLWRMVASQYFKTLNRKSLVS